MDIEKLDINLKQISRNWMKKNCSSHISDIIVHFLISYDSLHTRRSYLNDLKGFFNYLKSKNIELNQITEVTQDMVLSWRESLLFSKKTYASILENSSVARKMNSLSALMKFAQRRKLLEQNPVDSIKRPPVNELPKTNALTLDEVETILSSQKDLFMKYKKKNKSRKYESYFLSYTILNVMFSVGLRVQELCNLRLSSLKKYGEHYKLKIFAKGQEFYEPIIGKNTHNILNDYISTFRNNAKKGDFIFVRTQNTQKQNPLSTRSVYNMVKKASLECGINKKISPHSCRATVSTLLHLKGVPLTYIQRLLNHKQVTTTAGYIKKLEKELDYPTKHLEFI
jgi:site-specific recombinase XerD